MTVAEDPRYSREYLEPGKRTNANAIRVHFRNGTHTERAEVEYPLGHRARRAEAMPLLLRKFERNVARVFAEKRAKTILAACADRERLALMPVHELMDLIVP
jgi:2-methylcitrate dehydratase